MGMERKEVSQLAVDDPTNSTICVFALNAKNSFVALVGVEAVAHTNPQAMKEDGNATMALLITLKP
jgi:hypothetical protein